MVIAENHELEKSVLAGVSCIAVPVEAFVPSQGEATITSYSFCIDKAFLWEEKYKEELLSKRSLGWLETEFKTIAEKLGYRRVISENELMLEYIYSPCMQMPNLETCVKIHKITSNAVLAKLCEESGCDIEIADDGEDIVFAAIEDGKLLAYAGMNDVRYPDGSVEISVETAPGHRRKGYGSACVFELTKYLLKKGISVRYKCSFENFASSALAQKCGFLLEGKRFSYVCEKI